MMVICWLHVVSPGMYVKALTHCIDDRQIAVRLLIKRRKALCRYD